ncbi:MAG: hypothetical protein IT428_20425 [Planctomycetaceae bacterium]|nr:hypothetical protein [Planctomycetaceae bacterium]
MNRKLAALVEFMTTGRPLAADAATSARDELQSLIVSAATGGEQTPEPCGRFFRHKHIVARAEEYLHDRHAQNVSTKSFASTVM